MKHLILYTLDGNKIPSHIVDGGYFPNSNNVYVGVATQYTTFDSRLTIWELIEHLMEMHRADPLVNIETETVLTDEQVADMAKTFYSFHIGEVVMSDVEVMQRKILAEYDRRIMRFRDQEELEIEPQDAYITYIGVGEETEYTGRLALVKYRQDIRNIDVLFSNNIDEIVWPTEPQ